jgi:hypothetical protein
MILIALEMPSNLQVELQRQALTGLQSPLVHPATSATVLERPDKGLAGESISRLSGH